MKMCVSETYVDTVPVCVTSMLHGAVFPGCAKVFLKQSKVHDGAPLFTSLINKNNNKSETIYNRNLKIRKSKPFF